MVTSGRSRPWPEEGVHSSFILACPASITFLGTVFLELRSNDFQQLCSLTSSFCWFLGLELYRRKNINYRAKQGWKKEWGSIKYYFKEQWKTQTPNTISRQEKIEFSTDMLSTNTYLLQTSYLSIYLFVCVCLFIIFTSQSTYLPCQGTWQYIHDLMTTGSQPVCFSSCHQVQVVPMPTTT